MRAKLPHTESKIDRDGVNLHYEVYGEGDHTILFIPTWAIIHSRCWKAQVPYFSEHFRVITFDPRGNGQSDRPTSAENYRYEHIVDDVIAVMDHSGTDKATLVGLSFSSAIAFTVAAYYPERTSAVVSTGAWSPVVEPYRERSDAFESDMVDNPVGWQKYNRDYWREDYADFIQFFMGRVHNEPHSTKQQEDAVSWGMEGDGEMLGMTMSARSAAIDEREKYVVDEDMYRRVRCPCLILVGDNDEITPPQTSYRIAELTGGQLEICSGGGHGIHGRFPAWFNTRVRNFLSSHLGTWKPKQSKRKASTRKALYLSSPIGLGHARRDLSIARELRHLHPDLRIEWLAQDPVTRFLNANNEHIHPASEKLANESNHIESEAGEHDLHAFQAIRNMDEILIANFMVFQEVLEQEHYDLVIADEAWEVDHYWHEHPELKKAQIAWLTDFVGWVPIAEGGDREAFLTTDYNAEMIKHVEDHPQLRDRAIFVGNPEDIVPMSFGRDLPDMRNWIPNHFDFCGYVLGQHPSEFGPREELRERFGYREGEKICIVTVGGSGVGGTLIRRILDAYPSARARIPELRMIVVTGPRLDPATFNLPQGVEAREFVPDLDQHLAAADIALVQGGLTTTMELTAAGTPFLYFPLRNHFEQNFHVAHRLDQYRAGRKMLFSESMPDVIAEAMVEELIKPRAFRPVESNGATQAASMLAELI